VHCFLSTPLLRRPYARQSLAIFLDWLADQRGVAMMEWGTITSDGPFHRVLDEVQTAGSRRSLLAYQYERALLLPRASSDAYLDEALSKDGMRELRRLERRLAQCGELRYVTLEPGAHAEPWIRDFLALEASGWKGRRGSAFDCSEGGRAFFTTVALEAARRGRLMMLALNLQGRPIAMKCNILAHEGAYAFKIAYDERYARFSPGTLLELENIRQFHARPALRWMDSCADPEHFMLNRLWLDRRRIARVLMASGRPLGDLVLLSLPLLTRLSQGMRTTFSR
jgi:CelD/BcsL family acetyltransferase involved in cellulose biosynthesis